MRYDHVFVIGPFTITVKNPGPVTINGIEVPRPTKEFKDLSDIRAWCRECLSTT